MPTKTDMPDRWYSTKEICAYLGISRDTMLVWISTKNMILYTRFWLTNMEFVQQKSARQFL